MLTPRDYDTKSQNSIATEPNNNPNGASKSDWNILFYLIGDGLISASMISQLKEITDAGFEENTNVLAYFDPNCNGKGARIFEVNAQRKRDYKPAKKKKTIIGDGKDPWVRDIAEDCHIPGLPQIPAEITLRYFLEYSRTYYPAKNYMVFLMGHGVIVGNDAFLPDPDDNSAITLADLGWILRRFSDNVRADGDEFHLVGFHSCSMSSVELMYELEGTAQYMIGTQGAAFPGSWPYRQLLKKIFLTLDVANDTKVGIDTPLSASNGANNGSKTTENDAEQKNLVNKILTGMQDLSFYNGEDFWLAGFSSDIALCSLETDKVNNLSTVIDELSEELQRGLEDPVALNCIRLAHLESQAYWEENYTDLFDFCSCLWERCQTGNSAQRAIATACKNVTLAINGRTPDAPRYGSAAAKAQPIANQFRRATTEEFDGLVLFSDYYGPAYQFSHGLSVYFPWKSPSDQIIQNYRGYRFTQEHGSKSWWSFLQQYFKKTRRAARQTMKPRRSTPSVSTQVTWRSEGSLLRSLSDERLLQLGPPPADRVKAEGSRAMKAEADPSKVANNLLKVGGDLTKAGEDLLKVGSGLSKVGGDLTAKVGGDLSMMEGDLADKVGGDLSKVGGDLMKIMGTLSKAGGDLSKVGGDLSVDKVGGDLSKVGGDLSKVGGDLSKVGGDLASKVGGDLAKVGGDLSKVGDDLSKVGGDLGGLYGHTVVKNFDSPEGQFITSRPNRRTEPQKPEGPAQERAASVIHPACADK
ncbi:MAG TPA: clostripain-related cysteine peptidase [Pyrinomonadaceae bacterium]|jgi:hypothetical protein|nr:clostripain-related cysteine peptidase [Pyrinomonadaceae bacterium]